MGKQTCANCGIELSFFKKPVWGGKTKDGGQLCLKCNSERLKNKFKAKKETFKCIYVGGHPDAPDSKKVVLNSTPEGIVISSVLVFFTLPVP